MDKYTLLLISWCEYLVKMQGEDGGFLCESCDAVHGRADNAVYPLTAAYAKTGDIRFLTSAQKVIDFREKLTCADGAVKNDFTSDWKGITAFSAINIYKTLHNFSGIIPQGFGRKLEACFAVSAQWVYENIRPGFHSYINYYAAAALSDAMYSKHTGNEEYAALSKQLLSYCMEHFSENGLICGEGQPHNVRTKKGCGAVDIGYNAEESMPCLIETAAMLGDDEALGKLIGYSKRLLEFMLPDGAWDNSFGSRNNKWTYYGSRTSDGCIGAFALLGEKDPVFYEAAERNFSLLEKCTVNGALYGGRFYSENGQKPCVHHTLCHACSLTDGIFHGLYKQRGKLFLPCEGQGTYVRHYPELDTYKIRVGKWYATVTGYDFMPGNYIKGASHASGGSISLIYHEDMGAVIAGSVYEYRQTEPLNMQSYSGEIRHSSLIPRAECEINGKKYASCLDDAALISVSQTGDTVEVGVSVHPASLPDFEKTECKISALYTFSPSEVKITLNVSENADSVNFILPICENTAEIISNTKYKKEKIFFLTGGFAADEYTFRVEKGKSLNIEILDGGHENA